MNFSDLAVALLRAVQVVNNEGKKEEDQLTLTFIGTSEIKIDSVVMTALHVRQNSLGTYDILTDGIFWNQNEDGNVATGDEIAFQVSVFAESMKQYAA